jgi:predicted DNA-binding transcriptional regulator AlpA
MQTKLLTVKEVAKRINKSVSTIYSYCREYYDNGQGNGPRLRKRKFIKPLRIGGTLQFKECELERWIAEGAVC